MVVPIPTGGRGSSQPLGAGPPAGGEATAGLSGDANSQTSEIVLTNYGGDVPPLLTQSPVPLASVPGATAGGTATDGLSSGGSQPGSAADEDEVMASILAAGPELPQQASEPGPISDGGAVAPGFPIPRSSQTEPVTDGDGDGSEGIPPTTPAGGGPAPSGAMVSGTAAPGEPAAPPSDIFVIQLGPAAGAGEGAAAAVSSASIGRDSRGAAGGARPLGRRQDHGGNSEYLMDAGMERSGDCSQAARFEIVDGELTRGGQKVSTSGEAQQAQRLAVDPVVGPVTRSWVIVGGELLWLNESFAGGRAGFCEDEGTRAVFFTTGGEGEGEGGGPVGCVPMHLTPMFVADCPGLNPDGDSRDLLPAEETLILPPGVYFPGRNPKNGVCKVTTAYWTVGQFTLAPAATGMSRRL
ncbi:hypothetical protein KVR01_009336 [Diaporthe batatas]|uniref:uncharacterized protein n=1 Tax=Diaporthe batatas TaxID=748121 RepID=UPI001D044DFF|nr:uncharacterized protein KVR01_009336 [Diaporthe batatas]KAG8161072.1 hypothetical protein KVR01_009336 [Diaporthe batatas]